MKKVEVFGKIFEEREMNKEEKSMFVNQIASLFGYAKQACPDLKIVCETPSGTVSLNIVDANIYEGMGGELVIDSE